MDRTACVQNNLRVVYSYYTTTGYPGLRVFKIPSASIKLTSDRHYFIHPRKKLFGRS